MIMASENSATEVFSLAVASRVHKNESEILQWLSPNELVPHMCKCGLVDLQEVGELILNNSITRRDKAKHILSVLKSKEPPPYFQFLECLKKETNHLGHAYIASLLEGKKFEDEGEVQASYTLQKHITECMTDLVKYVDVRALAPLLQQNLLLTNSEQEILINKTQNEQVLYLLSVLAALRVLQLITNLPAALEMRVSTALTGSFSRRSQVTMIVPASNCILGSERGRQRRMKIQWC